MQIRASKLRYMGTRTEQQDFVNVFQVGPFSGTRSYAGCVLTDGIGGLPHGREAGELVNRAASQAVRQMLVSTPTDDAALRQILREAALAANKELREFRVSNQLGSCGATLIACVLFESTLFFLSIGDSLILTLGPSKGLSKVNKAHVRQLNHRDALYSAVLGTDIPEMDQGTLHLDSQGIRCVLISSDGLSTVPTSKVEKILAGDADNKLTKIVSLAHAKDGKQDNLSMILLEVE